MYLTFEARRDPLDVYVPKIASSRGELDEPGTSCLVYVSLIASAQKFISAPRVISGGGILTRYS
jgi:hypothetical protein